jgi:predicted O-methyltransferase YrrM
VHSFADGSLDMVYIDACHRYDDVLSDLERWWPKVKPGGILAGHDVFFLPHPDVTAALVHFCTVNRLTADLISGNYLHNQLVNAHSYYICKERK